MFRSAFLIRFKWKNRYCLYQPCKICIKKIWKTTHTSSGSRAEKWKEQPRMGNLCCNQRATFNCWPKPRTSLRWTLHKLTNTSTFPRTWARRVFIFCTKSLKQWSVSLRLTRKPIWNLRLFILGVMERYFGWSFVCLFIYFWHSRGHIF